MRVTEPNGPPRRQWLDCRTKAACIPEDGALFRRVCLSSNDLSSTFAGPQFLKPRLLSRLIPLPACGLDRPQSHVITKRECLQLLDLSASMSRTSNGARQVFQRVSRHAVSGKDNTLIHKSRTVNGDSPNFSYSFNNPQRQFAPCRALMASDAIHPLKPLLRLKWSERDRSALLHWVRPPYDSRFPCCCSPVPCETCEARTI